jgi:hypothetical protein
MLPSSLLELYTQKLVQLFALSRYESRESALNERGRNYPLQLRHLFHASGEIPMRLLGVWEAS